MKKQPPPPTCSKCYYDLSGIPIEDEHYSCPECGQQLTVNDAYARPHYIVSTNKPILLGSLPPVALLAILLIPPFVLPAIDSRSRYCAAFIFLAPIVLLWPFLTGMHYAIKVERYKGPNRRLRPLATFLNIWISATALLCCAFVPAWLLAFAIFAGSTF